MHVRVSDTCFIFNRCVLIVPHTIFLGCLLPFELTDAQLLADDALRRPHLLEQVMNVVDLLKSFEALAE